MPSRHLVDPQLLPTLDNAPDMSVADGKLPNARAVIAEITKMGLEAADRSVATTEHFIASLNGDPELRVILYKPEGLAANAPVVLQIHGGGYIFGTAELDDPNNRAMAKAVGCAVLAVEYRLAPETPFPGGLNDCYAALTWLHCHAAELGFDPKRIASVVKAPAGDRRGAGGHRSTRKGRRSTSSCWSVPCLTIELAGDPHPYAGEFIWDAATNQFGRQCWLGSTPGSPDVPPLAAPARCTDLAGLPPTFMATAALDLRGGEFGVR
jgi:acetyl esterase/lipase